MREPTTSSYPVECEWQFEATGFAAIEAWIQAQAETDGIAFGPADTVRQRDLYFDTRDWSLFRADYGFRVRRLGRTHQAALKQVTPPKNGLAVRREITQSAHASTPAGVLSVPGPVTERLRLLTSARGLRPVADLRTTRRRIPILWKGKPAGEIALDRTLLHGRSGKARLIRIEVEVAPRLVETLRPFVQRLQDELGLTSAARSKLEWALQSQGWIPGQAGHLAPPTEILPTLTLGEVAYMVLRRHTDAVLRHEPGTRLGDDPEHLHDMRVATRRLRAALRAFAEVVPSRDRESLRRELQVLGQTLGAVRDLDVQMEQVQEWKSALITVEPESLDPFLGLLEEKRTTARTELLAFLDSARYRKLVARLRLAVRRGPLRRPISRVPVTQAAPDLIRRGRKRFRRQEQAMAQSDAQAPAPADYHRLRILGKRWRYTLEFLEQVYGPPAKPLIQALSSVQDILGLHQDAQVLLEELPALARRESGRLPESTRLALGEVAQLYAARAAQQRTLLPAALDKLRGKRWKALQEAFEDAPSPRPTRSRAHPPARQPPLRQK